jgi:hypothetical protein
MGESMCFVPIRDKKGALSNRYVRTKLVHTVTVTKANKEAIAKALGVSKAKLKPGKLHVAHEK